MVRASSGIGRWKAFWPLVLLALAVRIGLGGLAAPGAALDDPAARAARLAVFCDGRDHGPDAPLPHHPADAGEGALFLCAEILAAPDLGAAPVGFLRALVTLAAPVWCFPPVRGPPPRHAAALYAQGPPGPT